MILLNLKNINKKAKDSIYLLRYPWGRDKIWDEECDNNFSKFLDRFIFLLYSVIIAIPFASIATILIQKL